MNKSDKKIYSDTTRNANGRPFRIAIVGGSLSSWGGGTPRSIAQQARALDQAGCKVTLFAGKSRRYPFTPSELEIEHIPAFVSQLWGPSVLGLFPGALFLLWKRSADFDIIHLNGAWNLTTFTAGLIARWRNLPFVISCRSHYGGYHFSRMPFLKKLLFLLLEKQNIRHAHALHITTDWEEKTSWRAVQLAKRIIKIPNPVNLSNFERPPSRIESRKHLGLECDGFYVLHLGRLGKQKNLPFLMRAFHQAKLGPRAYLVFVGPPEPTEKQVLQRLAGKLGIGNRVIFVDLAKGRERCFWMAAADIFALPSHDENFCISAIEAVTAGTRCLLSPQVGAVEYLPNDCTAVCEKNLAEWSRELAACRTALRHPSLESRAQLAAAFSVEAVMRRWLQVYEQITRRRISEGRKHPKKIAFIHRYGLEGWICCGGHAVSGIVDRLSTAAQIHFYGPRTMEKKDAALRARIRMHELPYTWNRANPGDKVTKTILWYFWMPLIGLHCRLNGIRLIWNDETVPFTASLLRLFFGQYTAITVMDFFARIYTEKYPALRPLCRLVERIDLTAWKKLPLIFTKVLSTQEFLAKHGVPKQVMHLYRNPVDHARFHPVDEALRKTTRAKFGFTETDTVLSHHGILHPNKGNDWIFRRLKELKEELPGLKYLLIGHGPEMARLKQLASDLGLAGRIVFTGWLPSETELNNALASSDIGLVMRIGQETDHFHMTDTLSHEMACAKPILAVHLRGIAEIVRDGTNGYLFAASEPDVFCRRLRQLACSPSERKRLGEKALCSSLKISDIELLSLSVSNPVEKIIERL